MLDALYNIVIFPLEALIEIIYLLFSRVSHSTGLSILGVGIIVNVLTLPLYAKAERWQGIERETQKRLKPKVDDIKAVFRGDERMMILSTYYRQNGYRPIYALRSSFGLLLQVPFFIAAYAFIAGLPELRGSAFWFVRDLSIPDGLIALGGLRVNALPIAMTLINVAASAVYTKGFAAREKAQLYAMALLFLALLYSSPSGLVLYWTFNNLFSLCKNLVYKAKRPLLAFYAVMAACAIAAIGAAFFLVDTTPRKRSVVAAIGLVILCSPIVAAAGRRLLDRHIRPALSRPRERNAIFLLAALSATILVGLAIPTSLVASSTEEFSFVGGHASPFGYIAGVLSQTAGLFFFWPLLLYLLFGERGRSAIAAGMAALTAAAVLDVFAFGGSYGSISRQFAFPDAGVLKASPQAAAANLAALIALAAIVLFLASKRPAALRAALAICLVSLSSLSGYRAYAIANDYARLGRIRAAEAKPAADAPLEPVYRLSRRGKNVVVFMMDRAIGAFARYALEGDPALRESYRGFVLYPNTLSYNWHTLGAAPPLFGGYDYTPAEINARKDLRLVEKHDQALALMPRVFAEAGWASSISDASWANYSWVPDNSVFEKYPGVKAFNLEGRYTQRWLVEHGMETDPSLKISRNFIRFCLFKIAPTGLRFGIYDGGKWWDSRYRPDPYADFIDKYAPLDYLPRLVAFEDEGDTFTLIVNNATHETVPLSYPGCEPTREPQEATAAPPPPFRDEYSWQTYQVNVAALRLLAAFLDELRAEGAYDNTKIIVASDHGFPLDNPAFASFGDRAATASSFNPLLMIKDFGASGGFSQDLRFGTNADVPAIATAPLGRVTNPFTGKPLRMLAPASEVEVVGAALIDPAAQGKNELRFGPGDLIRVRDDLFEASNWSFPR